MALKREHFSKFIRNTRKFLKCGVGKGWKRSVRPIFRKMTKYYTKTRTKTWTSYIKQKRKKLNGMVTHGVGPAL